MLKFELKAAPKRKISSILPCQINNNNIYNDDDDIEEDDIDATGASNKRNKKSNGSSSLVIPLITSNGQIVNNNQQTNEIVGGNTGKEGVIRDDLDTQAENELLSQLTFSSSNNSDNSGEQDKNPLIIIRGVETTFDEGITSTYSKEKRKPLLLANIVPEILHAKDDEEKFKVDISLRARDMEVTSSKYKEVPIELFGAALLRGMGWQGPSDDDLTKDRRERVEVSSMPREQRLGLGALSKPPEGNKKSHTHSTCTSTNKSMAGIRQQERQSEWMKKAEDKIQNQVLNIGDIVWLRSIDHIGKRAQIQAVRGVAGLNKIRVCLEENGDVVEIKRTEVIQVSSDELVSTPYTPIISALNLDMPPPTTEYFGLKQQTQPLQPSSTTAVSSIGSEKSKSREETQTIKSKADISNGNSNTSERVSSVQTGAKVRSLLKEGTSKAPTHWFRPHIRVRIISKKILDGSAYLKKATVLEVFEGGDMCTLKIDSGRVLEGVRTKQVETIVPGIGGIGVVLRGQWVGQYGRVLEKLKETGVLHIQLIEDQSQICTVSMDDFADTIEQIEV